jgi:hypothetical protein
MSTLVRVLAIAVAVWLVYFVIEVSKQGGGPVWPFN